MSACALCVSPVRTVTTRVSTTPTKQRVRIFRFVRVTDIILPTCLAKYMHHVQAIQGGLTMVRHHPPHTHISNFRTAIQYNRTIRNVVANVRSRLVVQPYIHMYCLYTYAICIYIYEQLSIIYLDFIYLETLTLCFIDLCACKSRACVSAHWHAVMSFDVYL